MNYVFFIQGVSQVLSVISCMVSTESSSELLIYTQMKLGTLVWCVVDMDSRVIGCNFFFTSRRMVVFGCQSSNASRSWVNSRAKKWTILSSAIMSRSSQGI